MKTILAATDFSSASHNACMYGVELARAFNARLILFNAYQQLPVLTPEEPVMMTIEELKEIAQKRLDDEAAEIDPWNTITIETKNKEGISTDNILKAAKEIDADIIITGMKEKFKGFRKVLGSTVTTLVRKTSVPVIIVPEGTRYSRIDTIALATESDLSPDTDIHILDALRDIAGRFQPKLYLVRIAKDKFREAYEVLNRPFQLIKLMKKTIDPVYECIEGNDVPEALGRFIEGYRVNMLALLPHKHSLLERWFIRSNTNAMVFETDIPLLILPGMPKK